MTGSFTPPDLDHKKVLIVRLSALGDVIRTLPAVLGLMRRFPEARFTWLVEDSSAGLLRALPGLDLIEVPRAEMRARDPRRVMRAWRRVRAAVRAEAFDLSIDFHGVLKSGIYPLLSGIPLRIGYERGGSKEGHRWLINGRFALPEPRVSRYERNMALARFFSKDVVPAVPDFQLAPERVARVDAATADRPLLLFPGTSEHGRNKRWPAKYWAWLYRKLTESSESGPVRFVFGPADGAYREALTELLEQAPPELPSFSLVELTRALQRARLLVSCDSGPMHLASVLGVPLVAMLGPSDPVLNQPLPGRNRLIVPEAPCAPCRNRKCPVLICQDLTTPRHVWGQVVSLLEELEAS
ncbi:Glycosyltransferase family 9 protein [Sulfidibacter corallicola]|uniref:Glycosyltransferase family 9 protein n=1 Tax=Sulfidibacter corallicola TaxID=2818388 RepID=A0A8A4TS04_SULCO|nr:glycosyltransferase family 9 protein [Sulfidibacter corallicola]QTD52746.1 glycosyltransferase family 9 protein [Sulfidibacter corallicola]